MSIDHQTPCKARPMVQVFVIPVSLWKEENAQKLQRHTSSAYVKTDNKRDALSNKAEGEDVYQNCPLASMLVTEHVSVHKHTHTHHP